MAGSNSSNLGRQIAGGIGSFFGGNGQARQAGELAGLQQVALEDQIGQRRLAADAAAAKEGREADAAKLAAPDAALARALTLNGVPTDAAAAVSEYFRTGAMPTRAAEPLAAGLQGPEAPARPQFDISPDVLTKISQFFVGDQATQAGSSKTMEDFFKALAIQPKANLTAAIADGSMAPATGGARFAAIEGKPLVNANEYGVVDNFTGAVDATNPAAQRFAQYRAAQTGAQRANAAQSYAAAGASNASAARTRAEMADGTNAGGQKAPTGYRWVQGGGLEPIQGGPADPATKGAKLAKPPTEGQAKALTFGSRMQIADEVLNELADKGVNTPNYLKKAGESIPLVGTALGMAANGLGTDGEQQVEQAQRDFINAVLRRESGAAIGKDEFDNAAKQYFAQPGDSRAVLQQKASNRRTAISGMKAEFGEAGMPQFDEIVQEARASRAPATDRRPAAPGAPTAQATPRSGGTKTAAGPVQVNSDADYAALPPGTRFITPDGKQGTKR